MKKYIEPDIKLCYFEAERITAGTAGDVSDDTGIISTNLFAPDDDVTVTGSVKFADIQKLQ